ncbi:MAG: acyltransferase, partial [Thermomicrobia bacterium]|nr:acyltransferase [Thermomicrobia bacterium]
FVLTVHTWGHTGGPQYLITVPVIHYVISISGLIAYMGVGVDLFFVLSGFLLAQHWMRADYLGAPRPSLRRYFRQRIFRIVPAYYVCLFLTVLLLTPGYIPVVYVTGHFGVLSLLSHLGFMQYAFPFSAGSFGVDAQFWTLTIEAMFYVTLPFFVRFFLRNRWMIALPVAALLNVIWLVLCRNSLGPVVHFYRDYLSQPFTPEAAVRYIMSYQYPGHFLHFALGMTLANLYVRWQLKIPSARLFRALTTPWAGTAYFFVGTAVVLYAMNKVSWFATQVGFDYAKYVSDPKGWVPYYLHGIPFAIGFTLMMAGLLFGAKWLQGAFSFTPLRLVGVLGYSIYLWHVAVITVIGSLPVFARFTPAHRFPLLLLAVAGVLVVWCGAFYLAIEKPFMVLGRTQPARTPAVLAPQTFESAAHAPTHDVAATTTEKGFLRLFSLPSSAGTKVPYLDGIRAIAVIFVVLAHVWALSGTPEVNVGNVFGGQPIRLAPYFGTMFVGVDLFFVLSGFLLSQYWFRADFEHRPRPSNRPYFRSRLFRIVPAYYVCIIALLLFLTPFLIPPSFVYSKMGAFIFSAHLTFTQYLFPISAADYNIAGSLWTLTMEMIFYIVLPWAVILFLRNRWIVTLPLLALATLGWLYLCRHSLGSLVSYDTNTVARYGVTQTMIRDFLARQFPAFFVDFGVGIVAANLYWQFKTKTAAYRLLKYLLVQWMGTLYFFLGCGVVVYSMNRLATHEGPISYYLKNISVAVGFVLMIAGMMAGSNWLQALFSIAPLRFIGIIGYSIFLWHMPLIYLFNKYPAIAALPPGERFARVLLLTSVAVLILGALSYLFVEKPFILMSRRRPVVAATYAAVSPSEVVPSHIPAGNPVAVGSR